MLVLALFGAQRLSVAKIVNFDDICKYGALLGWCGCVVVVEGVCVWCGGMWYNWG